MAACARLIALTTILLLIATPAPAVEWTMTLDNVAVNTCETVWWEESCKMQVVNTIVGDYTPPGFCIWFPQADGLALMGARLVIDVSNIEGIDWVEVDLREVSGDGRTRLFVYAVDDPTNYFNFAMSSYTGSATDQTLMMDTAGYDLGTIAISGHEALIEEVRISGFAMVDLERYSWGTLKTRW